MPGFMPGIYALRQQRKTWMAIELRLAWFDKRFGRPKSDKSDLGDKPGHDKCHFFFQSPIIAPVGSSTMLKIPKSISTESLCTLPPSDFALSVAARRSSTST